MNAPRLEDAAASYQRGDGSIRPARVAGTSLNRVDEAIAASCEGISQDGEESVRRRDESSGEARLRKRDDAMLLLEDLAEPLGVTFDPEDVTTDHPITSESAGKGRGVLVDRAQRSCGWSPASGDTVLGCRHDTCFPRVVTS